jgi:hypothetical protein
MLTTVSVRWAYGDGRAAHRVLVIYMLLWGACVETLVLAPPPVSGLHVMPAPGLRAVWNDLTPLVFSAMQRSGAASHACPRANAGAGGRLTVLRCRSGETELEVRFGLGGGVGGSFPNGVSEASFQRLCSVLQRSCDAGQLTPISGYPTWRTCAFVCARAPRADARAAWSGH